MALSNADASSVVCIALQGSYCGFFLFSGEVPFETVREALCVIRGQKGLVKDRLHVGVFVPIESPGRGLFFGSVGNYSFELRFETFYDFADPVEVPFSVVE